MGHHESMNDLIERTVDLVCAYVSNNHVAPANLPALVASVHAALTGLGSSAAAAATADPAVERPTPAQVRKSVTPEALVSFVDGKGYKTLKRHLTVHGLTPASYRERYGLSSDYPMVAPSYAARRSALAKSIGLGQVGGQAQRQAKGPARKAA